MTYVGPGTIKHHQRESILVVGFFFFFSPDRKDSILVLGLIYYMDTLGKNTFRSLSIKIHTAFSTSQTQRDFVGITDV